MWVEEGFMGFMRGNGTNVIRIVPYSAVQFASYEQFKKVTFFFWCLGFLLCVILYRSVLSNAPFFLSAIVVDGTWKERFGYAKALGCWSIGWLDLSGFHIPSGHCANPTIDSVSTGGQHKRGTGSFAGHLEDHYSYLY